MRPTATFYVGLSVFFVLALAGWSIGLQAIAHYLWTLLAGLSRL